MWWKFGKPADVFVINHELIHSLIKEYKLPVLSEEFLTFNPDVSFVARAEEGMDKERAPKRPRLICGGMRIPHVHYKNDIYLMEDKQWHVFTQRLIKDFRGKLASAKTVSFDKLLELSSAIDTM